MITDALEAYEKARRMGEKYVAKKEAENEDPYLPVLDELLKDKKTAGEYRLGLKDLPLEEIVGTKTKGRSESFAGNFMPLLPADSEFGYKWTHLYASQLEEGLRDPIKVYEYMHKYYVQEGNKRVSVMRFVEGVVITAQVIRIMPAKDDSEESQQYYTYLDFAKDTGLDELQFSQSKSFKRFYDIMGIDEDSEFPADKKEQIEEEYRRFEKQFLKMGGDSLSISVPDAFLLYIEFYGFDDLINKTDKTLSSELQKIWKDFEMYPDIPEVKLVTETVENTGRRSLFDIRFDPLKVAFVHARSPETSTWTARHEGAREYVQSLLNSDIKTTAYFGANDRESEKKIIEQAIKDGNEVIFTTSPNMARSSLRLAAEYPNVKIFNCSLNTRTGQMATYFARMYEVQFLFGMIAGILTKTDQIGYVADYPLYGMIANINAFALGARMTNPQAKIFLDWSTTKQSMLKDIPRDIDVTFIAGQEFDPNVLSAKEYGLYDSRSGEFLNIAVINYYWGAFYLKMLQALLHSRRHMADEKALNYWYGFSNGLLGMQLSEQLPTQMRRLITVMKDTISDGSFNPFSTVLADQEGNIHNKEDETMDPEEIVNMDWLLDNVVGQIPNLDDFGSDTRRLIQIHGINKVKENRSEEE